MSHYYRTPEDPDPFENQAIAARKNAEERARIEAAEKDELAKKGGSGQRNPLYDILNAQPATYADDALMQKNPPQYIMKKYGNFLEKIRESYRELGDTKSSMQIFIRMFMNDLKLAAEAVQRGENRPPYDVKSLQRQLTEMSKKDGFTAFKRKWQEKFPDDSFEESRDACLADLEQIKAQAQIKRG